MKLDLYFARRFLASFALIFGVFFGIVLLIDLVELMRKLGDDGVGVTQALVLALLNSPATMYRMLPLLIILATIFLFLGLARSSEMVITRAAGRSALRSLFAPVCTALMLGVLGVAAMNPIVAATSKQFEATSNRFTSGPESVATVTEDQLWLRQSGETGQVVIRADRSDLDGTVFYGVTFYGFDLTGRAIYRIEAEQAELNPGAWAVTNAKRWTFETAQNAEARAETHGMLPIPSDLTQDQIRDSFGDPGSIPIWQLPAFIRQLDRAGFSALKHRVWFQMELANPALLAAMVLIGAAFTMRHTRFGRTGLMVLIAVLTGFTIYFLRNFAQVLGENGQIPVLAAAWAPPLAGIFLALGLLLHTEDG